MDQNEIVRVLTRLETQMAHIATRLDDLAGVSERTIRLEGRLDAMMARERLLVAVGGFITSGLGAAVALVAQAILN